MYLGDVLYLASIFIVMYPPSSVIVQVLVLVPVPFDELVVVELQLWALPLSLDVLDHEHDDGEGIERQHEQNVHPEMQNTLKASRNKFVNF